MHLKTLVSALFLILAVVATAGAQQSSTFAERVDVNAVNVDVLVSTKQGAPATGLAKNAFQLQEDDEKVKIDGFSEEGAIAGSYPSIVLYVDDTHVAKAGRDEALESMRVRLADDEITSIVGSIIQGEQLGTPLALLFRTQADVLRIKRTQRAETMAGEAGVKMLLPAVLVMAAIWLIRRQRRP